MPEFMTCFACENEPTQQCPRCGRPYCDEHGEDVCDACLAPASGLPSFTLYRGSLLALLVATALAVWLLIQPPGGETTSTQGATIITPTSQAAPATTPPAGVTEVGGSPAPDVTSSPEAEETPPASSGTNEYTVQAGDTLSSICANEVSGMDPVECVNRVVELSGLADPSQISPGDVLTLPQ